MIDLVAGLPAGLSALELVALLLIFAVSGVMSGLSGFGFSAMGAMSLVLLPPKLAVPLLMGLSIASQLLSLGSLRAQMKPLNEWFPHGPGPFLAGGLLGAPIGIWVLQSVPTGMLMLLFGNLLVFYAAYSFKASGGRLAGKGPAWAPMVVGFAGGVMGGFTAFPGAAVVIWVTLRGMQKTDTRAIVQPFILGMQLLSVSLLSFQEPSTFGAPFWSLLALTLPVVLPCTLLGAWLYHKVSDLNFRKIVLMLLGSSGFGIVVKGSMAFKVPAFLL